MAGSGAGGQWLEESFVGVGSYAEDVLDAEEFSDALHAVGVQVLNHLLDVAALAVQASALSALSILLLHDHVVQNLDFFVEVTLNVSVLRLRHIDDGVLFGLEDLHLFFLVRNLLLKRNDFVLNFLERSLKAVWQQTVLGRFDGKGLRSLAHDCCTGASHCGTRHLRLTVDALSCLGVRVGLSNDSLGSVGVAERFRLQTVQVTAIVVGLGVESMTNLH